MRADVERNAPLPVGLLRRLGALAYDVLLLFGVLFMASLVIIPLGLTRDHPLYPLYVIYVYLIAFVFFGWFWTHQGQTLGMKAWHIRLTQMDGDPLTWRSALIRTSSAVLLWLPAAFGYVLLKDQFQGFSLLFTAPIAIDYLWCLTNRDRLALHDILSRSRLVKV